MSATTLALLTACRHLVFVEMRFEFHHSAPNVACGNKTQKKVLSSFFVSHIHHNSFASPGWFGVSAPVLVKDEQGVASLKIGSMWATIGASFAVDLDFWIDSTFNGNMP